MGKSKKSTLGKLPPDWREDFWRVASSPTWRASRPQLLPALAAIWLTGCRPTELASGVLIGIGNGKLAIEVKGAKLKDANSRERGQPTRHYLYDLSSTDAAAHPALVFLKELAQTAASNEAGIRKVTVRHDPDYLYNSVVAVGKATYPTLRTRISPYVFRHQTGADLKADPDVTLEEAARAMGHLSDYSIAKYGHAAHGRKGGRGRVKPVLVRASRPIKHSPKVDRLARFKIASVKKRQSPAV